MFIYIVAYRAVAINDREMGGYTRVVSGQRFSKNIPAATDKNATGVQQQRNDVFCDPCRGRWHSKHISAVTNPDTVIKLCFLCCPCRDVIIMGPGKSAQFIVSSVRESVKRGLERVKNLHC
jgi:hypothetical protein